VWLYISSQSVSRTSALRYWFTARLYFTKPLPPHTHTYTHTRAHARTHARTHASTHARTHTHTHTHTHSVSTKQRPKQKCSNGSCTSFCYLTSPSCGFTAHSTQNRSFPRRFPKPISWVDIEKAKPKATISRIHQRKEMSYNTK